MGKGRVGLLVAVVVGAWVLGVGCGGGGGGGGSGGDSTDRTPRVTGVSVASAVPFSLVDVTGEGMNATAETYVQFADAGGSYAVSVPAVGVSSTAVTVSVPPYFGQDGQLGGGSVSIRVIQTAGGQEIQSTSWEGFQILELPETGLPPGTVTLDFARAVSDYAEYLATQITGTTLDTVEIRAEIEQLQQAYAEFAGQVEAVMAGDAQDLALGAMGGTALTAGLPQLEEADRMLVAIVGKTGDAQLGRAVLPAELLRQQPGAWDPALALRPANRLLALGTADYTDCLLNSPESACSRQRIQSVSEAIAEAFKRAYQVIAGSAGVVLGTMTLGGAPALATALPSAALSYVQLIGGSGLIAVGGALQQTTPEAKVIVQQGVTTFNSFLQGLAETFAGTFVPGTEEPLAVKSILEGGADLFDAFGLVDLDPEPTGGGTGSAGSYSGSFTGTTTEVSNLATLTYEIIGAVTTTLEGGAGTMIDPYRGTLVVEGTVFVDCTPNLPDVTCQSTSAPFLIEGPVEGSFGTIEGWAGGASAAESPAVLEGGVLGGDELSGQLTFDVGCYWDCAPPIVKTVNMVRMP